MIDDQQAQQIPEGTQDAPMPSAEQQPTPTETSPQGEGQVDQGLPEGVKDRTTQQFEKLQTQLREERRRRELAESAFTQRVPEPQVTPMYDPETGLLNENAFTETQQRAHQAEQRAMRAEEMIQSFQKQQEDRELFQSYPDLNPEAKEYDEGFDKLTAAIWYGSAVSPQRWGKQLSTKEAASEARKILSNGTQQARDEGAQQALEQLAPKEQAALSAQGNPARRTQINSSHDDLVSLTRKGGKTSEQAIVERLKGIPWANG